MQPDCSARLRGTGDGTSCGEGTVTSDEAIAEAPPPKPKKNALNVTKLDDGLYGDGVIGLQPKCFGLASWWRREAALASH